MSTPFDIFKETLLETTGATLARRGYALQDDPIQTRSGLYRFAQALNGGALALVDVQLLFYPGGGPSRFEVKVWRSARPAEKIRLGAHLRQQSIDTLADESGWWEFASAGELDGALRDAASGLERMLNED